jgi:hypothetical protein
MAQHDYVIANQSGASFRADLNNGLAAIVSNNSGASAPSTTFAFQWWADTTNNVLKMRNAANDGWITIRELDGDYETVGLNNGTAAAPSLYFAEDADDNTGLFSGGADQLNITTGGTERAEFGASEVVFNDGGANYDFRVEGDTNTNLVVVDASADSIGIGTNAPGTLIEIDNAAPYVTFKNNTEEDTDGGRESRLIFEGEQSGGEISTLAQIEVSHDGTGDDEAGKLIISTNDGSDGATPTTAVTIDSSQNVTLAAGLTVGSGNVSLPADLTVAGSATVGELNGGQLAGTRNFVINGGFQIDQRNGGTAVTPAATGGTYTVDRFRVFQDVASTLTVQQQTAVVPAGFTHAVEIELAAVRTPTAAQQFFFGTTFEANNFGRLGFGAAGAVATILSFWVRASVTGTYSVSWTNDANDRSYIGTYAINTADTWEHKTVTFTGDTTGTWVNSGTGRHSFLQWDLGAGSDFDGTADTWQAGNLRKTAASVDFVSGTVADTFYLAGVQLETGTVATPFEHRSYGQELSLCQRYYTQLLTFLSSADNFTALWPTTMRVAPAVTSSGTINLSGVTPTTTAGWFRDSGAGGVYDIYVNAEL